MRTFLENASLLMMLVAAAIAVLKFRARRYLLVLMIATAVGAWFIGYVYGAKSTAQTLYPFVPGDRVAQAIAVVDASLPSPIWGLAFALAIIVLDHFAFGFDARKAERIDREVPTRGDPSILAEDRLVTSPPLATAGADRPLEAGDGA